MPTRRIFAGNVTHYFTVLASVIANDLQPQANKKTSGTFSDGKMSAAI
jgi:hypothetical protein